MISASPNKPIDKGTKPIPSMSASMPMVMRYSPVDTSVPTRPSRTPSTIMPIALSTEPCASTTAETKPSSMTET